MLGLHSIAAHFGFVNRGDDSNQTQVGLENRGDDPTVIETPGLDKKTTEAGHTLDSKALVALIQDAVATS